MIMVSEFHNVADKSEQKIQFGVKLWPNKAAFQLALPQNMQTGPI